MTASTRRSAISPALNALTPDYLKQLGLIDARAGRRKPTSRIC